MYCINNKKGSLVVTKLCLFIILFTTTLCGGQDKLIDVGDYKLQYRESGVGSPVIVFLNGGSAKMDYWDNITKEISKVSKVITYERAGHDKSQMGITIRIIIIN